MEEIEKFAELAVVLGFFSVEDLPDRAVAQRDHSSAICFCHEKGPWTGVTRKIFDLREKVLWSRSAIKLISGFPEIQDEGGRRGWGLNFFHFWIWFTTNV